MTTVESGQFIDTILIGSIFTKDELCLMSEEVFAGK